MTDEPKSSSLAFAADLVRENRKLKEELLVARGKIAYYEAPIPMGKGNCFHLFTDEGRCIRCGEDAESWDAGCVEEIVEDLQSVTTREFADALKLLMRDKSGGPIDTLSIYRDRIEKFAADWEMIERWREDGERWREDDSARIDIPQSDGSDAIPFSL